MFPILFTALKYYYSFKEKKPPNKTSLQVPDTVLSRRKNGKETV